MNKETSDIKTPDFSAWIGRQETQQGCVSELTASTVHATLGDEAQKAPKAAEPLPALWHWYGFPPTAHMSELGPDGHPKRGGFLPPIALERRMWASGSLTFKQDIHVDEPLTRTTTIANVAQKSGTTGDMIFLSLDHVISGENGPAIEERQEIVYLRIAPKFTPPPKRPAPTEGLVLDKEQAVSAPLLFRYSAITFNAHRIHYDLPYTQEIEHYPHLVVHGPLQANLLAAEATRNKGTAPKTFRFRGVHPLFADADMHLCATAPDKNTLELCTVGPEGHMGMQATATWET